MTETNKVALVTGANKGIGYEIVRGLAKRGVTVLLGARDAGRRDAAVAKLAAEGLDVTGVPLDVTDAASVEAAAKTIEERHGRLDILVNNAGITGERSQAPGAGAVAEVRRVFDVNVFGVIAVTDAMLPLLRRAAGARVVNMSSSVGSLADMTSDDSMLRDMPAALGYPVSKAALNAVTAQYAKHLRDEGIPVNSVCPGYTATDLNGFSGHRTPEQGAAIAIEMALAGADGPTAGFFDDAGRVAW
ncbi:MAG TPA: SDR family oxidoreductase [Actinophytocola sp.]|jgi:NAD(P)-dependent dehydrogenase (short-subunit alcohol dehydrogenase family)|uniref:SDR family oxidoreductase n=1 Tax=Actinophytocola sp. TaxID=1872138 RepID=UPI002F94F337